MINHPVVKKINKNLATKESEGTETEHFFNHIQQYFRNKKKTNKFSHSKLKLQNRKENTREFIK